MAAIKTDYKIDMDELHRYVEIKLPDYARPLFLRIQSEIDVTGTFKHRKVDLVKQGFNPTTINEPLYFDDPTSDSYVPLNADLYRLIELGQIRL